MEATGYTGPGKRHKKIIAGSPLITNLLQLSQDPEKWQIHNYRADFGKAKTKTKVPVPYYLHLSRELLKSKNSREAWYKIN